MDLALNNQQNICHKIQPTYPTNQQKLSVIPKTVFNKIYYVMIKVLFKSA